jgi:hypothetical protein
MQRSWILLAAIFLALASGAQTPNGESDESRAIRKVAELYLSAEPANLEQAFDATANLYTTDEKGALRVIPFHDYLERVRKNAGTRGVRKGAIRPVEHAGNAAMVEVVTTTPEVNVTDYLSLLRLQGQWKVVSKTFFVERHAGTPASSQSQKSAATESACGAARHHIFDFMIGSWHTSDSSTPNVAPAEGESAVEATLDGCVIHEHRHLTRQGKPLFDGDAYWGYDLTTKRWLLFYMDDASHFQVYEGREETGHLAFYRERPDPDGKPILIRIAYAPIASGYTQTVERSGDHGATWQAGGVTTYVPKR